MTSASEEFTRGQGQSNDNRGRMVLFIGLGLGALAAILVAIALTGGDDDGQTVTRTVPATRLAVAAVADIPARSRLTRDMLEVQTYNAADVDPEAFTAVSQVLNRVTAVDIAAGEVIVPSLVSSTTGEGLPFAVNEGMRAISITVSEVVIAGGNLAPNDRVDIIGYVEVPVGADVPEIVESFTGERPAEPLPVDREGASLAFTLLQNVRVIAVAQDLTADVNQPSGETTRSGALAEIEVERNRPNPGAGTITLEVTPEQAQIMATANIRATLRLALRPFGDDEEVDVAPFLVFLN